MFANISLHFVEAVKRDPITGEPKEVIFSDSWNIHEEGKPTYMRNDPGALVVMDFDKFIKKFSGYTSSGNFNNNFPENKNFRGYIQFDTTEQ